MRVDERGNRTALVEVAHGASEGDRRHAAWIVYLDLVAMCYFVYKQEHRIAFERTLVVPLLRIESAPKAGGTTIMHRDDDDVSEPGRYAP